MLRSAGGISSVCTMESRGSNADSASPELAATPFHAGILSVRSDSASIGPVHRQVLREKKEEFQRVLYEKVNLLQVEAQNYHRGRASQVRSQTPCETPDSLGSVSLPADSPPPFPSPEPVTTPQLREHQEGVDQLRVRYQERLDDLYNRFQREWMNDPRDREPIDLPMSYSSDSQYMAECLGRALTQGLAEICEKRPCDPIEYLAHWLKKHAYNTQQLQQKAVEELKLKLEQEELVLVDDHRQRLRTEIDHLQQENDRRKAIYMERTRAVEAHKAARLANSSNSPPDRGTTEVVVTSEDGQTVGSEQVVTEEAATDINAATGGLQVPSLGLPEADGEQKDSDDTTGNDVVVTGSDVNGGGGDHITTESDANVQSESTAGGGDVAPANNANAGSDAITGSDVNDSTAEGTTDGQQQLQNEISSSATALYTIKEND